MKYWTARVNFSLILASIAVNCVNSRKHIIYYLWSSFYSNHILQTICNFLEDTVICYHKGTLSSAPCKSTLRFGEVQRRTFERLKFRVWRLWEKTRARKRYDVWSCTSAWSKTYRVKSSFSLGIGRYHRGRIMEMSELMAFLGCGARSQPGLTRLFIIVMPEVTAALCRVWALWYKA